MISGYLWCPFTDQFNCFLIYSCMPVLFTTILLVPRAVTWPIRYNTNICWANVFIIHSIMLITTVYYSLPYTTIYLRARHMCNSLLCPLPNTMLYSRFSINFSQIKIFSLQSQIWLALLHSQYTLLKHWPTELEWNYF